ncbi:MAG: hypothetical protein ACI97A_001429 [Planctomycetota bacterium]|jgi:hypothetical protein
MKLLFSMLPVVLLCGLVACGEEETEDTVDNTGHAAHSGYGSHGGELLELGSTGHLEVCHSASTGEVKIYITGADAKTVLAIAGAPVLKVPQVPTALMLTMKATNTADGKASEFVVTNDALKVDHLHGRISLKVGDLTFNPDLASGHGH